MTLIFREGKTKGVGKITRLYPISKGGAATEPSALINTPQLTEEEAAAGGGAAAGGAVGAVGEGGEGDEGDEGGAFADGVDALPEDEGVGGGEEKTAETGRRRRKKEKAKAMGRHLASSSNRQ
jgi:hypothetical protein